MHLAVARADAKRITASKVAAKEVTNDRAFIIRPQDSGRERSNLRMV